MSPLHNNLVQAIDLIIDEKLEIIEEEFEEKIEELKIQMQTPQTTTYNEIMQQKDVFGLLGIGRRRLKNWVDRGLDEIRVDNRVYYRYSDLMQFIENGK